MAVRNLEDEIHRVECEVDAIYREIMEHWDPEYSYQLEHDLERAEAELAILYSLLEACEASREQQIERENLRARDRDEYGRKFPPMSPRAARFLDEYEDSPRPTRKARRIVPPPSVCKNIPMIRQFDGHDSKGSCRFIRETKFQVF